MEAPTQERGFFISHRDDCGNSRELKNGVVVIDTIANEALKKFKEIYPELTVKEEVNQ